MFFPGTEQTTEKLKWIWSDGPGAPSYHRDLKLPNKEKLPNQGAMFIGEKGRLLLPHFMELPKLIVDGKYKKIDLSNYSEAQKWVILLEIMIKKLIYTIMNL